MNIPGWEVGRWMIKANSPKVENTVGECSMWACWERVDKRQRNQAKTLKATNIICSSVLLDMSTPDKKRIAVSLDSRRKWRSALINSCFLGWNGRNPGLVRAAARNATRLS
jgi:hypothetical protein